MRSAGRTAAAAVSVVAVLAAPACAGPDRRAAPPSTAAPPTPTTPGPPAPAATGPAVPPPAAVLVGAGDIASCGSTGDSRTAALLDRIPGTVFTLGDNVYDDGAPAEFAQCYGPTWGRHRSRTRPVIGNHDYHTPGAAGYFGYFGAAAGASAGAVAGAGRTGWYSYDLGAWHVVVLDSNCGVARGGCAAGSPQERWLRADLASSSRRTRCTVAMWHHPLFTSGRTHGPTTAVRPLFRALYEAGAELVLSGHNHQYERFAPQDPAGRRDDGRGLRQFVVGTGGVSHYGFGSPARNSQVRRTGTYGVLRLTLREGGYDWSFVPVAGEAFTDSGRDTCH
ncbi:MAG TPA: metallophosphoesterase [Micromonosporaceae bacterium]|nr:metallophosphoesterase [Micromonosporaceae bacterium]